MIDPLNTNGRELWMSLSKWKRRRFHLSRVNPDVLMQVKIVLYLAYKGDARAIQARGELFTWVKGAGYFPKEAITKSDARRATAPVLLDVFAGLNGRRF